MSELREAARPADPGGVFDHLSHRRARRATLRRVQAGALAVVVLAATGVGFVALRSAFRESRQNVGENVILPANGEIVFSAGGEDGFVHLYAMQPDGTDRRQITDFGTDDTAPAVSPDGTTIAFVHQLEDVAPAIATIPIGGGVVTWLTDPDFFVTDGPTWSPDGTKIAFTATHGEGQRVYVMGADGSDPGPITPEDVFWPDGSSWSPDGTKIAFAASPISGDDEPSVWDIYTASPDGGELTNVTQTSDRLHDEGGPTWSPDGERIAFTRNGSEGSSIVIRRLSDGVETTRVTDGTFVEGSPAWSPDGRWIAFDRAGVERDTGEHPAQQDLWLVHPDGTGETRLTTDGAFAPAWQPIPSISSDPEVETLEGVPFPVCSPMWIPGSFGGRNVETVIVFQEAPDGRCDPAARRYIGIREEPSGEVTSYTGPISPVFQSAKKLWPYSTPDLDGDGIDEVALGLRGSKEAGFVEVTFFRIVFPPASNDTATRDFDRVESECGAGCDPYQPFTIGQVESGKAGVYCGSPEGGSALDAEGVVQWSTGIQSELGTVRAYVHEYGNGILRFATSTSWGADVPDGLPPTGSASLCGSATYWPEDPAFAS